MRTKNCSGRNVRLFLLRSDTHFASLGDREWEIIAQLAYVVISNMETIWKQYGNNMEMSYTFVVERYDLDGVTG